jgi:hypothetical protein
MDAAGEKHRIRPEAKALVSWHLYFGRLKSASPAHYMAIDVRCRNLPLAEGSLAIAGYDPWAPAAERRDRAPALLRASVMPLYYFDTRDGRHLFEMRPASNSRALNRLAMRLRAEFPI